MFNHYGDRAHSYTNLMEDQFDWSRTKGGTSSHGTFDDAPEKLRDVEQLGQCIRQESGKFIPIAVDARPESQSDEGWPQSFDRQCHLGQECQLDQESLCSDPEERHPQTTLPQCPSATGVREKVICYLWEVANQNAYLRERQKYRFNIIPDGNCLYRALSRAAYGKQSMHSELREQTVHYIADHLEEFGSIVEGDAGEFLINAAQEGAWAGYPEMLAMSEMLNVNIYLTTGGSFESPTVSTMVHFLGKEDTSRPVVWLSWLSNGHYDVVLNRPLPNPEYEEWTQRMQTQVARDEEVARSVDI